MRGEGEGLSLWWNDLIEVHILRSSKNLIHFEVRVKGESEWLWASWVYRNPYRDEKRDLCRWISQQLEPQGRP